VDKIWTIAVREYRAIVGAKAFLIALVLMPVLMFAGIAVQSVVKGHVSPKQKRIVVLDGTGVLLPKIQEAAKARNELKSAGPQDEGETLPRLEIEAGSTGPVTDQKRLELADRARGGEIDAFVEIPADVFQEERAEGPAKVIFYAENAPLSEERGWLAGVIGDAVRTRRLELANIDPDTVRQADMPVPVQPQRLPEKASSGEVEQPAQASEVQAALVPFGMMMLMWMVIFLAAQPMLESAMEEKSQRIAEVLLGSVNCFQLMLGKLLGGIGGSLTVLVVYGIGGYLAARHYDVANMIPMRVLPWFIAFQVLAVLLFGSIFMAIGASVNQIKEAQGLLLPAWLFFMYPLFVWFQVVQEPNGSLATWLSLVPPGIPLMMVLRIGASAAVPLWQPLAGMVIMVAFTLAVVVAAARVFRIGILAQGKAPSMIELVRWAMRG
jgi:ABC-type Na+ efflux pump permease subunit